MSASGEPFYFPRPDDRKLDSWKEIADYLDREVRTVQRWEKTEGLPVHRHEHQKKSTVYAYTSELDDWRKKRQPKDDPEADAAFEPEPDGADVSPASDRGNPNRTTSSTTIVAGAVSAASRQNAAPTIDANLQERPRQNWLAIGVVVAAAILVVAFAAWRWFPRRAFPQRNTRLVVIPFTNLSGDPKQDYFSAGLTDEMITRLGSLDPKHLGVIAARSSMAVAGKPLGDIGRALDVQYAVEGSVRRDGNRVRIDVQLIQLSDQTQRWADSYDRELNDILHVQEEVASAVASQIRLALNPSPNSGVVNAATRSVNPEAYDAYLWGRFYWTHRGDLHKSIEAYQQAIQKDPQYALAYAGLASSYALLGQVPYDDLAPSDAKPKAREAAKRALDLDPELAEAHAVLGNVAFSYDWNFEVAEHEFQRSFALGPNNPTTPYLWYGHYCIVRNRLAQAMEENSRLLEIEPVSPLFNTGRAEIYYYQRNYDAAITQATRAIDQYPNYWLAYIWLGSAYREKKMYRDSLERFSQARTLSSNRPVMIALYGHALAVSGDAAGARKALADLENLARSRYVSPLYFAVVHLGLGENNKTLDWLDRAYRERTDRLVYLDAEPMADPLRSDPRFAQLLHKIGIP